MMAGAEIVGKVTLSSGLEATFHEDWTWTVIAPADTPSETASLTKQLLEFLYRPNELQPDDMGWVLDHLGYCRECTIELTPKYAALVAEMMREFGDG